MGALLLGFWASEGAAGNGVTAGGPQSASFNFQFNPGPGPLDAHSPTVSTYRADASCALTLRGQFLFPMIMAKVSGLESWKFEEGIGKKLDCLDLREWKTMAKSQKELREAQKEVPGLFFMTA